MNPASSKRKVGVKLYAHGARPELDSQSSYARICDLIKPGSRVLDVGCGSGVLAAYLTARGDRVWGADLNPDAVERARANCVDARVADLETQDVHEVFPGQKFDVIVFADVLEHTTEPWRVLESSRSSLETDGRVIASLPNFGHAAVRLAVAGGSMPYRTLGILDDTHVRFFTRDGVESLFEQSGFRIEAIERTFVRFGAPSDLVPDVGVLRSPEELERYVREQPESETLQFVVRALPLPGQWNMAALRGRLRDVEAHAAEQSVGIRNLERELAASASRLAEATRLGADLARKDAEIAALRERIDAASAGRDGALEELGLVRESLRHAAQSLEETNARLGMVERERDEAAAWAAAADDRAARQVEAVVMTADTARAHALDLDAKVEHLRAALLNVEGELDGAVARADEATRRIDGFRAELEDAQRIAESAQRIANDASERLRVVDERRAELHVAHAAERSRADALRAALAQRDGCVATLNATVEQLQSRAESAEAAVDETRAALAQRDGCVATLNATVEQLQSRAESAEAAVDDTRTALAKTEAALEGARARIERHQEAARHEMLVRIALEHELTPAQRDGEEFWRDPS